MSGSGPRGGPNDMWVAPCSMRGTHLLTTSSGVPAMPRLSIAGVMRPTASTVSPFCCAAAAGAKSSRASPTPAQ